MVSGRIASGQIGLNHLAAGAVQSGNIGSGQVGPAHLASGQYRFFLLPTVEAVSGLKAVCIASGNFIALAMAGSGLRLPTVGVIMSNYASGALAQVITAGVLPVTSGMDQYYSGQDGRLVYAGSGGGVQAIGGMVSGQAWQRLGTGYSGSMLVEISTTLTSGANATPAGNF